METLVLEKTSVDYELIMDKKKQQKNIFYKELYRHLMANVSYEVLKQNFPKPINVSAVCTYNVPSSEIIKVVDACNNWYPRQLQDNLLFLMKIKCCDSEQDVMFVFHTVNHVISWLKAYMEIYHICKRYINATDKENVEILNIIKNICKSVAIKLKAQAKRLYGSYPDMSFDVEFYYYENKRDLLPFVL